MIVQLRKRQVKLQEWSLAKIPMRYIMHISCLVRAKGVCGFSLVRSLP
jgi:hypothetical protein